MVPGRRDELAGSDLPRDLVGKGLSVLLDLPPDFRRTKEPFDQPRRTGPLVETGMGKARHESAATTEYPTDFADRGACVLHVHQGHVACHEIHAGIPEKLEAGRVRDPVLDPERLLRFPSAGPFHNPGRGIDGHDFRALPAKPTGKVPVPASQVQDAKPTDLPHHPQECGVDESSVPEITGVTLLRVVPLGHSLPGTRAHGGLHPARRHKHAVRLAYQHWETESKSGRRRPLTSPCEDDAMRFIWNQLAIEDQVPNHGRQADCAYRPGQTHSI